MTLEETIQRINELYHKSQKEGLSEEEKQEQKQRHHRLPHIGHNVAIETLKHHVETAGCADDAVATLHKTDVSVASHGIALIVGMQLTMERAPGSEIAPTEVGWQNAYACGLPEELNIGTAQWFHNGVVDGDAGALWEEFVDHLLLLGGVEMGCHAVHDVGNGWLEGANGWLGCLGFPEKEARVPVVATLGQIAEGNIVGWLLFEGCHAVYGVGAVAIDGAS